MRSPKEVDGVSDYQPSVETNKIGKQVLCIALKGLEFELLAVGFYKVKSELAMLAKGLSFSDDLSLQISIIDDDIPSIGLVKLTFVNHDPTKNKTISIEMWKNPENHLSGMASTEQITSRIKKELFSNSP